MNEEIDLSKYQVRTDLAIDSISNKLVKGVKYKTTKEENITVTDVELDKTNDLGKKSGKYITIEFEDTTDSTNKEKVIEVFMGELNIFLKPFNINHNTNILIVGLGNKDSTPDSLGPLVIENIIVTNHLYKLNELSTNFSRVSAISPGVMGSTGIETSEIIEAIINKIKPDLLIAIDSLASKSIERLNKTIQITDTGIQPGSGIGNKRKEISKGTLGIPVIAIGVPTVVDATIIVSDTINYIYKNYSFNKKYLKNPKSKLTFNNVDYLKKNINLDFNDKEKLFGLIGKLTDEELQILIYEVLNPIGYNLMVTPKEIDFVIKSLSDVISTVLNKTLHNI